MIPAILALLLSASAISVMALLGALRVLYQARAVAADLARLQQVRIEAVRAAPPGPVIVRRRGL